MENIAEVEYNCSYVEQTCKRVETKWKKGKKASAKSVVRLCDEDTEHVERLITEETYKIFGKCIDVEYELATSFLSLGIVDEDGELVAAICAHDYPDIPAISKDMWVEWFHNQYSFENVNSKNTLFIHFMACTSDYTYTLLKPFMTVYFHNIFILDHIIMIIPPGVDRVDCLDGKATRILPKGLLFSAPGTAQSAYLLSRHHYINKYKIRYAVEEDNDDLVPLIDKFSKRLREMYGDFYIAEILTRHPDCGRQIVVAEMNGTAVAVVIVNENVNYDALNINFHLEPYFGLKKMSEEVKPTTYKKPMSNTSIDEIKGHTIRGTTQSEEHVELTESDQALQHELIDVQSCSSEDFIILLTTTSVYSFEDENANLDIIEDTEQEEKPTLYTDYLLDKAKLYISKDLERRTKSATPARYHPTHSTYVGEPNAFVIEIVAAHKEHEQALPKLLMAIFECFPEREYCLLSMPSTFSSIFFSKFFSRVIPRSTGTYPDSLFIMHKNVFCTKIEIEETTVNHEQEIYELMSTVRHIGNLPQIFQKYLYEDDLNLCSYVMLSQGQVVGFALLGEEFETNSIKICYNIKDWVNKKLMKSGHFGFLYAALVVPQFQIHTRFFLKELHRLTDFHVIFYKLEQKDLIKSTPPRSVVNVLSNLIPILPRLRPIYNLNQLDEDFCPQPHVLQGINTMALYLSTITICSIPRVHINNRIVVIGASTVADSVLENLLWKKNRNYLLTFFNVTLISPRYFGKTVPKKLNDIWIKKDAFPERSMDMLYFKTCVNRINGIMTAIDRTEKYITVNNNSYIPYDTLILACGEQFQKPKIYEKKEIPKNVFIINSVYEAYKSILTLKDIIGQSEGTVIVYGHYLQAYVMIQTLIESNLNLEIVFVEPFPHNWLLEGKASHNISVYNNGDVDHAVMKEIHREAQVYQSYYFVRWHLQPGTKLIKSARFQSHHKMMDIDCAALYIFDKRGISNKTFQAIIDAGIVFDGRIVINADFQTNDKNIYAAGTVTKYSRKYYAGKLIHRYYDRNEVGYKLAQILKKKFVPASFLMFETDKKSVLLKGMRTMKIPTFDWPLIRYCKLPGYLYYLSITKPGLRVPLQTAMSRPNYGTVFETGDCNDLSMQGYFRLHINQFETVETITCLSKQPIDVSNLVHIWGKHEKLLNNLRYRYEMILIRDFFDFFKRPWAYALYSDRFDDFLLDIDAFLLNVQDTDGKILVDELVEEYKNVDWRAISDERKQYYLNKFKQNQFTEVITDKLLAFLEDNMEELPMYANRQILRLLLHDVGKSPLFKTKP